MDDEDERELELDKDEDEEKGRECWETLCLMLSFVLREGCFWRLAEQRLAEATIASIGVK